MNSKSVLIFAAVFLATTSAKTISDVMQCLTNVRGGDCAKQCETSGLTAENQPKMQCFVNLFNPLIDSYTTCVNNILGATECFNVTSMFQSLMSPPAGSGSSSEESNGAPQQPGFNDYTTCVSGCLSSVNCDSGCVAAAEQSTVDQVMSCFIDSFKVDQDKMNNCMQQ